MVKLLSFFLGCCLVVVLSSCAVLEGSLSKRDDKLGMNNTEITTTIYDEFSQVPVLETPYLPPLTKSLAYEKNVMGVGVKMGDTIVEAKKYDLVSYQCTAYDQDNDEYYYSSESYNHMDMIYNSRRLVSEGVPVIKYSQDYKLIDNIEAPDASDVSLQMVYDAELDKDMKAVPTAPGLYWMVFTVSYDDHPRKNKEITPVLNEWYITDEMYWVGVIVE